MNLLKNNYPQIAREWDHEKNKEINLSLDTITQKSGKKAFWFCAEGHSYSARISHRTEGSGCPYCSKTAPKTLKGYNDMWTTHPSLAQKLKSKEDGFYVSYSSSKLLDWVCEECGNIIKNKAPSQIYRQGLSCTYCSDGVSFPEKLMSSFLEFYNISFTRDTGTSWSENYRFDFIIENKNVIIETHGAQHYESCEFFKGEKTQLRDAKKRQLVRNRKNIYYFEINCSSNNVKELCTQIEKEAVMLKLLKIEAKTIPWKKILQNIPKSLIIKAANLYNNETQDISKISEILKLHRQTVLNYLKQSQKMGLIEHKEPRIMQLDQNFKVVKIWESIHSIEDFKISGIRDCCNQKQYTSQGFKWQWEEEFSKLSFIKHKNLFPTFNHYYLAKSIQTGKTFLFENMQEIQQFLKRKNIAHVSSCIKKRRKSAYGYLWKIVKQQANGS